MPIAGELSDFRFRASPEELRLFFPVGYTCEQLNCRDGEGQILIDGNEWGIYDTYANALTVVLHAGDLSYSDAKKVVNAICRQLSIRTSVEWKIASSGRKSE